MAAKLRGGFCDGPSRSAASSTPLWSSQQPFLHHHLILLTGADESCWVVVTDTTAVQRRSQRRETRAAASERTCVKAGGRGHDTRLNATQGAADPSGWTPHVFPSSKMNRRHPDTQSPPSNRRKIPTSSGGSSTHTMD